MSRKLTTRCGGEGSCEGPRSSASGVLVELLNRRQVRRSRRGQGDTRGASSALKLHTSSWSWTCYGSSGWRSAGPGVAPPLGCCCCCCCCCWTTADPVARLGDGSFGCAGSDAGSASASAALSLYSSAIMISRFALSVSEAASDSRRQMSACRRRYSALGITDPPPAPAERPRKDIVPRHSANGGKESRGRQIRQGDATGTPVSRRQGDFAHEVLRRAGRAREGMMGAHESRHQSREDAFSSRRLSISDRLVRGELSGYLDQWRGVGGPRRYGGGGRRAQDVRKSGQ